MVLRAFVFALMLMVGFGCKKPKEQVPPVAPDLPVGFSMSVNNAKWTANKFTARAYTEPSSSSSSRDTVLTIDAYDTVLKQSYTFSIVRWDKKTGKYSSPRNGSKYYLYFIYDPNPATLLDNYQDVSGSVTITKITHNNIQGLFNTDMVIYYGGDTISITNGLFNIPYTPL